MRRCGTSRSAPDAGAASGPSLAPIVAATAAPPAASNRRRFNSSSPLISSPRSDRLPGQRATPPTRSPDRRSERIRPDDRRRVRVAVDLGPSGAPRGRAAPVAVVLPDPAVAMPLVERIAARDHLGGRGIAVDLDPARAGDGGAAGAAVSRAPSPSPSTRPPPTRSPRPGSSHRRTWRRACLPPARRSRAPSYRSRVRACASPRAGALAPGSRRPYPVARQAGVDAAGVSERGHPPARHRRPGRVPAEPATR